MCESSAGFRVGRLLLKGRAEETLAHGFPKLRVRTTERRATWRRSRQVLPEGHLTGQARRLSHDDEAQKSEGDVYVWGTCTVIGPFTTQLGMCQGSRYTTPHSPPSDFAYDQHIKSSESQAIQDDNLASIWSVRKE